MTAVSSTAGLNGVAGVAFDPAGNLYISVYAGVQKIYMLNASNQAGSFIAGQGNSGYSGDGSAATSAQFRKPSGMCYYNGALYIGESLIAILLSGLSIEF